MYIMSCNFRTKAYKYNDAAHNMYIIFIRLAAVKLSVVRRITKINYITF